ncbi:uncharacterized protein LOC133800283 [Humulus lupulus]|uniref:uncharacterized protein LOC133800283 n=1 Tax=Humulus lupulus TaxID=3486 RepID=UPI002B412484|nr:uncharacterized protein LOC133800283 [Humulus lupulus]
MGNGNFLLCTKICKEVELVLQGHKFMVDLYVLPICGLDVVLGMQWLQTLGSCVHDHKALTMEFNWQGSVVKLAGSTEVSAHQLTYTQFHALLREGDIKEVFRLSAVLAEPTSNGAEITSVEAKLPKEGHGLLTKFAVVFEEPKQLPPYRGVDHRFFLQPSSKPINVRPYRYPHFQKDVIEKLVKEMSDVGFIRPSTSPYSSPVLLVKKKDGTWRFCVDYRALNGITVKDRFPIPTIDELLDELGTAAVFSKLDLRAGYHQIRMDRRDIHKTAFRTHEGHYEFLVMPFGLTNAPSTFQAAMNQFFRPYLRQFVIVFFDDILVYSNNTHDHVQHLEMVLQLLQQHGFFAKASKCQFFQHTIEYLGHMVSYQAVKADPSKISAMVDWPIPKNVKQLRGFLGLTGYYRKFVAHYAAIAAPLIELLKKDNFKWSTEAAVAFDNLKQAMIATPVLRLPDFSKEFVVETDASNVSIGGVLMQEGHPVAYYNKKLGPRFAGASVYSREIAGKQNLVADALSRQHGVVFSTLRMAISSGGFEFLEALHQENITCPDLRQLHIQYGKGELDTDLYSVREGLLYFRQRFFISEHSNLKSQLLKEFHASPIGGHAGVERTFLRLGAKFFWKGMHKDVRKFVQACLTCQTVKYSPTAPYGLLQPLAIPERVWEDLAMDFIVGLPNSHGVTNILVVIDRLTKYAHFGALPNHYSATKVAELFSNMVIRLHGLPRTIVSDRDPIFTSAFWKRLFELMGTTLKMSSAYHPQTDGQTEVTNCYVEQYFRAFTADNPKQWSKFLSWAEYHYNTSFHSAIGMTPFQAVYGRPPPTIPSYIWGATSIQAVENDLLTRDDILQQLKTNLQQAQNRMRQQANKRRRDIQFKLGDLVLIKLQPYRQTTVANRLNSKLSRRYFGPFEIVARAGPVAYTLKLPQGSRIHPTFHVSLLRPYHGTETFSCYPLPELTLANRPVMTPLAVLATRIHFVHNKAVRQVLVQWTLSPPEDATWEDLHSFCRLYDLPNLEDKVVFGEGSSDSPAQLTSPITLDPTSIKHQMKKWEEYSNVEVQSETNDAKTEEREGAGNKEKELAPEIAKGDLHCLEESPLPT